MLLGQRCPILSLMLVVGMGFKDQTPVPWALSMVLPGFLFSWLSFLPRGLGWTLGLEPRVAHQHLCFFQVRPRARVSLEAERGLGAQATPHVILVYCPWAAWGS